MKEQESKKSDSKENNKIFWEKSMNLRQIVKMIQDPSGNTGVMPVLQQQLFEVEEVEHQKFIPIGPTMWSDIPFIQDKVLDYEGKEIDPPTIIPPKGASVLPFNKGQRK